MTKHKWNKLFSIATMTVAFILIIAEYMGRSEYKNLNILSYVGLFFVGAYYFYLNRKHERKMKDEQKD